MDSGCDSTHFVIHRQGVEQRMNDERIVITFKDGTKETIYCCNYEVKNGCLAVSIRFKETRVFPLDNIKEFDIY